MELYYIKYKLVRQTKLMYFDLFLNAIKNWIELNIVNLIHFHTPPYDVIYLIA